MLWAAVGFLVSSVVESAIAQPPLNVVLIIADDLGWSDVGCYGADLIETPNIDALAENSVRFTQAYAPSPVCSPTRASILTGKSPARLQMTIWSEGSESGPQDRKLLQAASGHDLPLSEVTLAEHFRAAGYLTALVGKWHLGNAAHSPETQGFDVNIGGTHWGAPASYFFPYQGLRSNGEFRYVPDLEFGSTGEYLTDRLTVESERVIEHAAANDQSFFLMLCHHAPHTPVQAKQVDINYFAAKVQPQMRHQHPVYAAMIRSLDQSVGQVLSCIKERGLSDNTVVIFTSDNGGYIASSAYGEKELAITSNEPLRSGKGTCYEGGLRVPLIVKWPNQQARGDCHEPVILTDLAPTLLTALPEPTHSETTDGVSLRPLLSDTNAQLPREDLYFHYPHYYHAPPSTPVGAIRSGDLKLIEFFEDQRLELYDLKNDPGESRDLAAQRSSDVQRLHKKLKTWRQESHAALPTPNTLRP
jgi:arylsulfatase A-like enzyme